MMGLTNEYGSVSDEPTIMEQTTMGPTGIILCSLLYKILYNDTQYVNVKNSYKIYAIFFKP